MTEYSKDNPLRVSRWEDVKARRDEARRSTEVSEEARSALEDFFEAYHEGEAHGIESQQHKIEELQARLRAVAALCDEVDGVARGPMNGATHGYTSTAVEIAVVRAALANIEPCWHSGHAIVKRAGEWTCTTCPAAVSS